MSIYPPLTASLLGQLTDRDLQFNYLNYLDRTSEIASLLAQITDQDLASRIINLALEVDLNLGADLTSSVAPDLQAIIVEQINQLEIPIGLKIELWTKIKSKATLPYLQDIFIFKNRYPDYSGDKILESAIAAIIQIDRELAIILLCESLYDSCFYVSAAKHLASMAPPEAIDALGDLLESPDFRNCNIQKLAIYALSQIGTNEAIKKIRNALFYKCRWSDDDYIRGLGIVADPPMVEHLIYLLYEPERYIYRSTEYPQSEKYYADRADDLCHEAIEALELIGGEKVFDWLHQAMYWVSNADEFRSPFDKIVQALFKLDMDRASTALEGAIQSYDSLIRKRAAIALGHWKAPMSDRNLAILLNAIDDPDIDVQLEIVTHILDKIHQRSNRFNDEKADSNNELRDQAISATKTILIQCSKHPDPAIRERIINLLLKSGLDDEEFTTKLLDGINAENIRIHPINFRQVDNQTLLSCLENDSIAVRTTAISELWRVEDELIISMLCNLVHDPEYDIRESAIRSIVRTKNITMLPLLLEIAASPELVTTLISELTKLFNSDLLDETIFSRLRNDREFVKRFIETAERTLVENIRNKIHHVNGEIFALRAIGGELAITALQEILEANDSYDDIDQSVLSLADIGTELAMSVLLGFLPDVDIFYGWISNQYSRLGEFGLVPQLWSAQRQIYSDRTFGVIATIQEREGLYNPDFSNRSYPLFRTPVPRLRDFLLGNHIQETGN
jgi:HEAT repeat protein